jgi:hypothetical protein
MSTLTGQKIATLYEQFAEDDLVFTREIIEASGLISQQVAIKCGGNFIPCILCSSSFKGAQIATTSGLIAMMQEVNNMISLRLCFRQLDTSPLTFFVSARSAGYAPYGNQQDMSIFTLQFMQRPPDDLIEIFGRIAEATTNAIKRGNERIIISDTAQRKLSLLSKDVLVFIQGVPRRCMLRELSFSGAKVIMMGVAKFLVNKEVSLKIEFDDPQEGFMLKGKFTGSEEVGGRKDLVAFTIQFVQSEVPIGYKMRINSYVTVVRVEDRMEQPSVPVKSTVEEQIASLMASMTNKGQSPEGR